MNQKYVLSINYISAWMLGWVHPVAGQEMWGRSFWTNVYHKWYDYVSLLVKKKNV